MTSPVIYMPLNQDLINANLTVEQIQEFQHVDNVVEVQLEPSPTPPQLPPMFDAAFYHHTNSMVNALDKLLPLLNKMVSDRRSPTAGASDNVSHNPVASPSDSAPQVPVVAPQDPGLAPGPPSASSEHRFHLRPPAAAPGCFRLPTWSFRREGQRGTKSPCLPFASGSSEASDG